MSLDISEKVEQFIYEIYRELPLKGEVSTVEVRELSGGYHNHVFLVSVKTTTKDSGKFVLKINRIKKFAYKMKAEFEVLKFLRDKAFAPSVFYFNPKPKILESPTLLEEFVSGKELRNLSPLTKRQFEEIARLMASLHANTFKKYGIFPPSKKGTFFDAAWDSMERTIKEFYVRGYLQNLEIMSPELAKLGSRVEAYIERVRSILSDNKDYFSGDRFSLAHGDFGIGHMLVSGKRLVLIDWETARVGDSVGEVAYFFAQTGVSDALQPRFLKLYEKHGGPTDTGFLRRLRIALAVVRPLDDMLWALERAFEDPEAGIETLSLSGDLGIHKEFVPYKELLRRRLVKLEEALGDFKSK